MDDDGSTMTNINESTVVKFNIAGLPKAFQPKPATLGKWLSINPSLSMRAVVDSLASSGKYVTDGIASPPCTVTVK